MFNFLKFPVVKRAQAWKILTHLTISWYSTEEEYQDTRIKWCYETGPDIQVFFSLLLLCLPVIPLPEDVPWKISQEKVKNSGVLLHLINSTFSFESFQL